MEGGTHQGQCGVREPQSRRWREAGRRSWGRTQARFYSRDARPNERQLLHEIVGLLNRLADRARDFDGQLDQALDARYRNVDVHGAVAAWRAAAAVEGTRVAGHDRSSAMLTVARRSPRESVGTAIRGHRSTRRDVPKRVAAT